MLTKLNLGDRKGPKSRGGKRVAVTALYHTYNRDPKKMGTYAVEYDAPADATLEQLIELAHKHGATVGDHSLAGVYQVQTPAGVWVNQPRVNGRKVADGKLLTRSNSGVSPTVEFIASRGASKKGA